MYIILLFFLVVSLHLERKRKGKRCRFNVIVTSELSINVETTFKRRYVSTGILGKDIIYLLVFFSVESFSIEHSKSERSAYVFIISSKYIYKGSHERSKYVWKTYIWYHWLVGMFRLSWAFKICLKVVLCSELFCVSEMCPKINETF